MNAVDETADLTLSPEELRWWDPRREAAYEALALGDKPGLVAERLSLQPRTLLYWRRHPFWEDRHERDLADRRRAHADQLSLVDEVAVRALPGHVTKNAPVALRYLDRRGLLTMTTAVPQDTSPGADIDLDNARDFLPPDGPVESRVMKAVSPALPRSHEPAHPEPPAAPPRDLHVPYPPRLRTWERKLLEEGKLQP